MKLQILIPQYKETDSQVKSLLDSIAIQQNVDFDDIGVIITNDGTDVFLDEKMLNSYPFKVEYYKNFHGGVSATRDFCFQKATADYVMFCDADDMFYNVCGLYLIFKEINSTGFDVFISYFIEEGRDTNNNPLFIDHKEDATFVHGKVFRRQFLINNKIQWQPQLTIHEDSYFNYLAQSCAGKGQIKLCKVPFYLWKWNNDSVCRRDKKYILKTWNNLIESSACLVKALLARGLNEKAQMIATNMIYDTYFLLNKKEWLDIENKEYKKAVEKRFKLYYAEFKYLFDNINPNVKKDVIIKIKTKKLQEGVLLESITFDDWIKKIQSL